MYTCVNMDIYIHVWRWIHISRQYLLLCVCAGVTHGGNRKFAKILCTPIDYIYICTHKCIQAWTYTHIACRHLFLCVCEGVIHSENRKNAKTSWTHIVYIYMYISIYINTFINMYIPILSAVVPVCVWKCNSWWK